MTTKPAILDRLLPGYGTRTDIRLRWRAMRFGFALAAIILSLTIMPTGAAAQKEGDDDSATLIKIDGSVAIPAGERINRVIVLNGNAVIDGTVETSIWIINGDLTLGGTVEGDVNLWNGQLVLSGDAEVGGDIALLNAELDRGPGSVVLGEIREETLDSYLGLKQSGLGSRAWYSFTALCLVIGLLIAKISHTQVDKLATVISNRPILTLGAGLGAAIGLPIAGALLLASFLTVLIGILLLVVAVPAIWLIGYILTGILIGQVALGRSIGILTAREMNPYASAVVGILLLQLVVTLPLVDIPIAFVAIILGSGGLLVSLFTSVAMPEETGDVRVSSETPSSSIAPLPRSRFVLRVMTTWFFNAIGFLLIADFTGWVHFDDATPAFILAALLGLVNAFVRPLILRIAMPLTVLTAGLFVLYIDAVMLQITERLIPGVSVEGFWAALATGFLLTLVNVVVDGVFNLDDSDSFYRYVARRISRQSRSASASNHPTVLLLEIDGLSAPVLEEAIANGYAPTLARWIESGSHQILEYDCGLPAQTSACQAGILYGDNFDIPAFRWFEKERDTLMVSNKPADAAELDARLQSRSPGLLHPDGSSIGNLVTGGAKDAPLTMAAITTKPREFARAQSSTYFYFLGPSNMFRTLLLMVREVIVERWEGTAQRLRNVEPRVHRGWSYTAERAVSTILIRDMETAITLRDLHAAVPVSYTMYVGYDVVAHHAGPSSSDALKVLRKIDKRIQTIERASAAAAQQVHLVVLSDHGQSSGATFLQRFGETLETLVRRSCNVEAQIDSSAHGENEGFNQFNAMLSAVVRSGTRSGEFMLKLLRRRTVDDAVDMRPESVRGKDLDPSTEIVVLASGNLGLIYLNKIPGRATREQIQQEYPELIDSLLNHPGIGCLMVSTENQGAVVIGAKGTHRLQDGQIEGEEDPLASYGPLAANHFRRLDSFPHVADIMVNSALDPDSGEVPAFEELLGSHGGLGGYQTRPFILHPAEWQPPTEPVQTANDVFYVLRNWIRATSVTKEV